MKNTEFDIIVVGAGSAGCALAYRLAKESTLEILLLEAGSPQKNLAMHIPLGFAFLLKEHNNNWNYKTTAEPYLDNREIDLPRGKVLGGCSSINGMVYVRGQHQDFDDWAAMGNEGWTYEQLLPYFKRSEDNENGASHFHGSGGPLWVGNVQNEFPVCDAFITACEQAGIPKNDDINGRSQEGAGFFQHNIKNGRRLSSSSAFLKAGKSLKNLTLATYANTHKVLLEDNKARGVYCEIKGKPYQLTARKEVILCAGAINSAKLLEQSGIGDKNILDKAKIPCLHHLPGVGENLHDHWNAYVKRTVDSGSTYYAEAKPLAFMKNFWRYVFTRKGFLANPAALVAAFYQSVEESGRAESQIHFAPAASELDAKGNMVPIDGITIAACGLRPTSRGSVHVVDSNPDSKPAIRVNYLETDYDKRVAIESLKKVRVIAAQQAMSKFGGKELEPGPHIESDEDLLRYIRTTGEPVHHLAGSCKMGNDEMAVVDHRLKVHGIEALRVADASIMPIVVSGNTHAACVMIGEKCADMVLQTAS